MMGQLFPRTGEGVMAEVQSRLWVLRVKLGDQRQQAEKGNEASRAMASSRSQPALSCWACFRRSLAALKAVAPSPASAARYR